MELLSSGEGETVVDEGTEWVLFLDSKTLVGRTTGLDIELPLARCEPREPPNELDLSIDELPINFNGLGPLDKDCDRSIAPNSDVPGTLLTDSLAVNVRGPGVDGREGWDRRVGSDCVLSESLGGNGGGSISSSSRVGGNRILADEAVLRALSRMEDCFTQTPSPDIVLCDLVRGEGPVPGWDLREANEVDRERAIDESRRVRGEGESSSSLYARKFEHQGEENLGPRRSHTYHSTPVQWSGRHRRARAYHPYALFCVCGYFGHL